MKMLRVDDDVHDIIKKFADVEDRGLTAYLNRHFRAMDKSVTPAIPMPPPKNTGVTTLETPPNRQIVKDVDVSDLVGNDTPRTAGDVLADIRELESARDEKLRYCQDNEIAAEISKEYKDKIQPLWTEYHELKGEK